MDLQLNGMHGQSLVIIGRALVEIGEGQERERNDFRLLARQQPEALAQDAIQIQATVAEQPQAAEPVAEEKPAKKPRKAAAAAAETPTPDSSAGADTQASIATPASPSEPAITLVDLRAKLADISRDGKADKVKALLSGFGVAKLTELEPAKFADVMAAAQEI
jgi:hypothetical protein